VKNFSDKLRCRDKSAFSRGNRSIYLDTGSVISDIGSPTEFSYHTAWRDGSCQANLYPLTHGPRSNRRLGDEKRRQPLSRDKTDHCFVCGKHNPNGLQLTFKLDAATGLIQSEFVPQRRHQGYDGMVHGGILASLMDEVMAHSLWQRGIPAVTAKMQLRYRDPVPVGERLIIYGRLLQERGKTAQTEGWLTAADGTRLVEATGTFFKLPPSASDRGES
jgi:acyl-coenzyme A thioesterase PaaI-like protein